MFGLSIGKLLLLAAVIAAVWFAYRMLSDAGRRARASAPPTRAAPRLEAEDMTKCRACGTYVPTARPGACGRPDCPYRT